MPCQEIHSWTFCGLVGAFLDLWLAYLMLCGSVLAFFASKFLGIFGWQLPCPCNGLFGDPHGDGKCLQRLLVEYPTQKISSVQISEKDRFPFDGILRSDQGYPQLSVQLLGDKEMMDGEEEEEASCSSISSDSRRRSHLGLLGLMGSDAKGKGIVNQRPTRSGLRRRRRAVFEHRKNSSSSHSPYSVSESDHEISEEGSVPPMNYALQDALNGSFGESKVMEKDASSANELVFNVRDELGFDGNEKNVIRVLEQALEEEKAERAALYLELEKERSAAATAADEAMAMILRLQEEKASIEMEARQYQRMIEEKFAYDAEEMDILKEILLRRERETHVLEKELETYRQIILINNESLEGDANDMGGISAQSSTFSLDSSEDPVPMLRRISEFIDKREIANFLKKSSNYEAQTVEGPSSDKSHPHVPGSFDDCNQGVQEKGMLSMDEERSVLQRGGQRLETEHGLLEKTIISIDEHGQKNNARRCQGVEIKAEPNPSGTDINFPCDGEEFEKSGENADRGGSNQQLSMVETEPSLYDVHVIDDRSKLCKEEAREESQAQLTDTASDRSRIHGLPLDPSGVSRIDPATHQPSTNRAATEQDICRSCPDLTAGLPPISNIHVKSFPFDLRRNSMSAVDNERLKLDTEVGWLRERLRTVQKEREKLSFSVEHREREKIQLQLLEDIAKQLQEIRQLTQPGKAFRHASLPPKSSKVSSKKRRCRSVSLGLHDST